MIRLNSDSMTFLSSIWQYQMGAYVRNIGKRGTTSKPGSQSSTLDPVLNAIPPPKSLDVSKIKTWIFSTIRPLSRHFAAIGDFEKFYVMLFKSLIQAMEEKLWCARFPSLAPTFLERVF